MIHRLRFYSCLYTEFTKTKSTLAKAYRRLPAVQKVHKGWLWLCADKMSREGQYSAELNSAMRVRQFLPSSRNLFGRMMSKFKSGSSLPRSISSFVSAMQSDGRSLFLLTRNEFPNTSSIQSRITTFWSSYTKLRQTYPGKLIHDMTRISGNPSCDIFFYDVCSDRAHNHPRGSCA